MSVNFIASKMQKARIDAGLTQAQVGDHLGVTYQAVSNYERGKTKIDTDTPVKLCSLYRINIGDVFRSPAWDEDQFSMYKGTKTDEQKLALFELWGVPFELLNDYNKLKEPAGGEAGGLSAEEYGLVQLFRLVPEDKRGMVRSMLEAALKSQGLL